MKIKIRPEHASTLQMTDWLAEFRDGESAGPVGPGTAEPTGPGPRRPGYAVPTSYGHGVPASPGYAEPTGHVRAVPTDRGYAVPAGHGCTGPAAGNARPEALAEPVTPAAPGAAAAPAGPAGAAVRAVIGDQLRMPIMWCEMGSCASWHADPAALGEADTRARAIDAGWRIDALGRLACPQCQQSDPGFWASRPVALRDRDTAPARTARIPTGPGAGTARSAALPSCGDPGRADRGYPPPSGAELEWHHDHPADKAHARRQVSGKPGRHIHSLAAALNPARAWRAHGGRQAAPGRDSEHSEDLMIREPARARPAGAMTSTGR